MKDLETHAITTVTYFRFEGAANRLWAFAQMGLSRRALRKVPDIGFHKLMGTGVGEGFTPLPNFGLYAVLAVWPDLETAERQIRTTDIFARYRRRAAEDYTLYLRPVSAMGEWSRRQPFEPSGQIPSPQPIAVLTRATLKPRNTVRFWKRAPSVSDTIGANPDVLFKAGMGEVPWLQQVTFSIWPDIKSMSRFAYRSQAHSRAIRAVRAGNWFREELYARFAVVGAAGTLNGADPVTDFLNAKPEDTVKEAR
ncbi:MAG: spheroidene monooxygenase [Pseudomonadota bacterium]